MYVCTCVCVVAKDRQGVEGGGVGEASRQGHETQQVRRGASHEMAGVKW